MIAGAQSAGASAFSSVLWIDDAPLVCNRTARGLDRAHHHVSPRKVGVADIDAKANLAVECY